MSTRLVRSFGVTLAAGLLAGACGPMGPTPSPKPTQDALATYRAIAEEVVAIRGLDAAERADPQVIDADQLFENYQAEFNKSNPEAQILLGERTWKALGLFPEDAAFRDIYLELQGAQIIGYYDSSVDQLFIVNRSCTVGQPCELGPLQRLTYAHEFTHELQDKAFDLESLGLGEAVDEGDRALAILGLVEGDAVSAQTTWMLEHLSPAELGEVAGQASDPDMLAILARTPAILLETSLFPYQSGAAFVSTLLGQEGYAAVNAAYDDLPASTEQILHPEKYVAGEAPIEVAISGSLAGSFGPGWTVDAEDTFGELQLRVWLREGGLPGDVARDASEGWGGDRIALLGAPAGGGDVIVISTAWDTPADATQFRDAAATVVQSLGRGGSLVIRGDRVVVAIGSGGPQGAVLDGILVGLATDPAGA